MSEIVDWLIDKAPGTPEETLESAGCTGGCPTYPGAPKTEDGFADCSKCPENVMKIDMMKIDMLCECNGSNCSLSIDLPLKEAQEVKRIQNTVIIVEGCLYGAEPTDTLAVLSLTSKTPGYAIYIEER